jgi:preprotein translocase subunit SecE
MLSPVTFFKEVIRETKKVTWPTKKQTKDMTILVVGIATAVGIYLVVLDLIFQRLIGFII